MKFIKAIAFTFILSLFSGSLIAKVKLASPFGDHMVLQRNTLVPIWGTASPGEKINLMFKNQKRTIIADDKGSWKTNLNKLKAGGPYTLIISGENTITLNDIYVGEVWICSGQSNLVPFAIRGALWYQGESNSPTASIYKDLMETLITDWRNQWGQGNFPFIYVQLANIGKAVETIPAKGGAEAIKREAQLQNLSVPNTEMVVAIDNADPTNQANIHQKNKQEIGRRLALAARNIVYGEKTTFSGPIYDKMKIEGNSIRLLFKHTDGGLTAKDNQLKGFAIAGKDMKFVWANASIEGKTIRVTSSEIENPVAVRYGWGSNPPTSLYNMANLPASPFRTDTDN
ncbi:MAG: hypothetical protein HXX14_18855 [Bacteroidetes bacterium]|nr:hypothetical protein [Bacteroidota bacterium]